MQSFRRFAGFECDRVVQRGAFLVCTTYAPRWWQPCAVWVVAFFGAVFDVVQIWYVVQFSRFCTTLHHVAPRRWQPCGV